MESGSERSTAMLSFAVDIILGCSPGSMFSRTELLTFPSIPTILFAASRLYTEKEKQSFFNCGVQISSMKSVSVAARGLT